MPMVVSPSRRKLPPQVGQQTSLRVLTSMSSIGFRHCGQMKGMATPLLSGYLSTPVRLFFLPARAIHATGLRSLDAGSSRFFSSRRRAAPHPPKSLVSSIVLFSLLQNHASLFASNLPYPILSNEQVHAVPDRSRENRITILQTVDNNGLLPANFFVNDFC